MSNDTAKAARTHGNGFVALRGIATNVCRRTRAEGAGAATAFHEVRFELDGLTVVSRTFGQILEVENGEEILVAGYFNGAEVWPQAWWNRSTEAGYEPPTWYYTPLIVLTLGMLLTGVVMVWINPRSYDKIVPSFGFLFLLPAFGAYSARCRRRAVKAIKNMKTYRARQPES